MPTLDGGGPQPNQQRCHCTITQGVRFRVSAVRGPNSSNVGARSSLLGSRRGTGTKHRGIGATPSQLERPFFGRWHPIFSANRSLRFVPRLNLECRLPSATRHPNRHFVGGAGKFGCRPSTARQLCTSLARARNRGADAAARPSGQPNTRVARGAGRQ